MGDYQIVKVYLQQQYLFVIQTETNYDSFYS